MRFVNMKGVKDYTQQLLDDFELYLKEDYFPEWAESIRQAESKNPTVNIVECYATDGTNDLVAIVYQKADEVGIINHDGQPEGFFLDSARAGVDSLRTPYIEERDSNGNCNHHNKPKRRCRKKHNRRGTCRGTKP